jgi:hypothetical protein
MGKACRCLICRRTEIRFQGFMIWRTGDQRREEVVVAGLACPGPDLISGTGNLTTAEMFPFEPQRSASREP